MTTQRLPDDAVVAIENPWPVAVRSPAYHVVKIGEDEYNVEPQIVSRFILRQVTGKEAGIIIGHAFACDHDMIGRIGTVGEIRKWAER